MLTLKGYRITGLFLSGEKTNTYLGFRISDTSDVFIKTLSEEYPSSELMASLHYEFEVLSKIQSEYVLSPVLLNNYKNGPLIVFNYFDGIGLNSIIQKKKFSVLDFLNLASRLAAGLSEIHKAGFLHLNIIPENILYSEISGNIKYINFSNSAQAGTEKQTNLSFLNPENTFEYISPEQTGRMNRNVDYRSDLYSLGIIFYEILTGTTPFKSKDPEEIIYSHIARLPQSPEKINPEIPEMVSKIILKLLTKSVEDRYQTARGLLSDLNKSIDYIKQKDLNYNFILNKEDVSSEFLISQNLYGREKELKTLEEAFNSSSAKGQLVFLSGKAGTGKTSICLELQKNIVHKRGIFLSGKSTPYKQQPYAPILHIFKEHIKYILTLKEAALNNWRNKISKSLGQGSEVLGQSLPELEFLIGPLKSPPILIPFEAENRFRNAILSYLKLIISEKPLVLLLDDLQWADHETIQLIEYIQKQPIHYRFLLICSYRTEEIIDSHPLKPLLSDKKPKNIIHLELDNINENDIYKIVSDTLSSSSKQVKKLSEIINYKTNGNPFFIHQFLLNLNEKKLIAYDYANLNWKIEIESIQKLQVTENVELILDDRMSLMSGEIREILQIASVIGHSFDLFSLVPLTGLSHHEIALDLIEATLLDLIEPTDKNYKFAVFSDEKREKRYINAKYRFKHDHILNKAYNELTIEEKDKIHFSIALHMQKGFNNNSLNENEVYTLANHYLNAASLVAELSDSLPVVSLYIQAGENAFNSAAFEASFSYFSAAEALLTFHDWDNQYDLIYRIKKGLGESAYLTDHYDESLKLLNETLQNTKSNLHKLEIYRSLCRLYTRNNDKSNTVSAGKLALSGAGFPLPGNKLSVIFHLLYYIIAGLYRTRKLTPESILNEPAIENSLINSVVEFSSEFGPAVYQTDQNLFALLVAKSLNLSRKYGNTEGAIFGYIGFGIIIGSAFGNWNSAYKYASMGLQLNKIFKNQSNEWKSKVIYYLFIHHWKKPIKDSIPELKECFTGCMQSGDPTYAGYAVVTRLWMSLFSGTNLIEIKEDFSYYESFFETTKNEDSLTLLKPIMEFIRILSDSEFYFGHTIKFGYDIEKEIIRIKLIPDYSQLANLLIAKMQTEFFLGKFTDAINTEKTIRKYINYQSASIRMVDYIFYSALSLSSLYKKGFIIGKFNFSKFNRLLSKLKSINKFASFNYEHLVNILLAEKERILNHNLEAIQFYEKAMEIADKNEFFHHKGLAAELAARHTKEINMLSSCKFYLEEALFNYRRWSSFTKIEMLKTEFSELLQNLPIKKNEIPTHSTLTDDPFSINQIDSYTIIKANQAISEEIQIDNLIRTLLNIILINSGASVGSFFLTVNNKLKIHSYADEYIIKQNRVESENLPELESICAESVVTYVFRTTEYIVLNHLPENPEFFEEEQRFNTENSPRSVLCVPVAYKNHTYGILYLENKFLQSAFTPERIALVTSICTQAAISLENVNLYEDLEKILHKQLNLMETSREHERLKEIEQARKNFIANISHELRTPLTLITGPLSYLISNSNSNFNEEQKYHLETIQNNSNRLLNIINGLLDFSKLESGSVVPRLEFADLSSLLSTLSKTLTSAAKLKNISFRIALPQNPVFIKTDIELLEKIIINLLSNAFKFTSEGGRIDVHLQKTKNFITLTISDTGIGIPENKIYKIFDRFSQAGNYTKSMNEGTGIGLALVKEFTELLGGEVTVHSEEGHGSVFTLNFPIDPIETETYVSQMIQQPSLLFQSFSRSLENNLIDNGLLSDASITESNEEPISNKINICIIEDDPEMRKFLVSILKSNYKLFLAEDGIKGLELIRSVVPDLILSDVMMSGRTGFELCKIVKKEPLLKNIPFIFLTSRSDFEHKLEGLKLGVDEYLSKPFYPEELKARINNLLINHKIQSELSQEKKLRDLDFIEASKVQQKILNNPRTYSNQKNFDIEVQYLPMNGLVSGDYYSIEATEEYAHILLADAAGHGIQAAMSTMQLHVLNGESNNHKDPSQHFAYINNQFVEKYLTSNYFTAFAAFFKDNKITYSSAAHPEQLLLHSKSGKIQRLKNKGKIIGVFPDPYFETSTTSLEKGDLLLMYTDGLTDQINDEGEEFGLKRLENILMNIHEKGILNSSARDILKYLMYEFLLFNGNQNFIDDVTIIAVKCRN